MVVPEPEQTFAKVGAAVPPTDFGETFMLISSVTVLHSPTV